MNKKASAKFSTSRVSEVDVLEKEAKDMEFQLKQLQSRMQQQQMEDDAVVKTGGCRWKSARPDKGSVLTYAKDVQDKYRSKYGVGEDPVYRDPPPMRPPSENLKSGSMATSNGVKTTEPIKSIPAQTMISFRQKDVETWSIADVGEWLQSIRLDTYAASFAVNEISGQVLLDISLDDLDYMDVTILGHRKLILKGIEDLRKNKRVTIQQYAEVVVAPASQKTLVPESASQKSTAAAVSTVHWSHLEPLSSQEVAPSSSAYMMANAADEEPDFLDEAAERAAFQLAVASWRGEGAGQVKIIREWEQKEDNFAGDDVGTKSGGKSADDGMWRNPFAPVNEEVAPRALDVGKASKTLPQPVQTIYYNSGEASLAEGTLDEAAEHIEFVKAVEAWRNRDSKPSAVSETSKITNPDPTAKKNVKPSSNASAAAIAMAAKIAQDMEAEQEHFAQRVQREKEAAAQRLEEARREGKENNPKMADIEFDCLINDRKLSSSFVETKHSPVVSKSGFKGYDPRVGKIAIGRGSSSSSTDQVSLSPASCSNDEGFDNNGDYAMSQSESKTPRAHAILLESKIGSPDSKEQKQYESAYLVEEEDDD